MMKRDKLAGESQLLHGELVFEGSLSSLANVAVHIFENTTLADASAKVVLYQVIENGAAVTMQNEQMSFAIHGLGLSIHCEKETQMDIFSLLPLNQSLDEKPILHVLKPFFS